MIVYKLRNLLGRPGPHGNFTLIGSEPETQPGKVVHRINKGDRPTNSVQSKDEKYLPLCNQSVAAVKLNPLLTPSTV